MGKAAEIYRRAIANGIEFECTCADVEYGKWEQLMEGATKANERIITKILVEMGFLDKFEVSLYNPYHHYKTERHLIYVHSGIEHFFRINKERAIADDQRN